MTMTPNEVAEKARQNYNATGDTFYSDDELYNWIWMACTEFAREAFQIERKFSTTTVAGTQGYAFPTNAITLKRVQYDGKRLTRITMREDDMLTYFDQNSTSQGEPNEYFVWDRTCYLRPIPDSAMTLELFCHCAPQEITNTSILEIPCEWHPLLVDYVVARMAAKEKNWEAVNYHQEQWKLTLSRAKSWARKSKLGDSFFSVQVTDE